MIKKSSYLFFIFLFAKFVCTAQNIDSTIAKYAYEYRQERTYLQYDKSAYAPGETIWFKAYLMQGAAPANESKTFYTDWTDDAGNLLFHSVSPVVDAVTNGQFDVPVNYTGKFIHVKAYTKWMLNFDSTFLYQKDIHIITKTNNAAAANIAVQSSLQFFPEGGDVIAGVANKIAFKANDQWGKPIKIKGIIQGSRGEEVDSLRIMHDGMGFFFLLPQPGETYTAKWKDENGGEHITPLHTVKTTGISLQVGISGTKRSFAIACPADETKAVGSLTIVGTMNQYQVFKVTKDLSQSVVSGIIPTEDLPSGILTITVFDSKWNALAERITYINNNKYRFNAEMSVEHLGLDKRARNEIKITVPDSLVASFGVSVTDAGIYADSSYNIISHLLLSSEIKGQVYNSSYYFSANNDTISQHLDLVMLTNGWRRFKWEDVAKGKLPELIYPRDASYLSLSGRIYGATPSQLRDFSSLALIINQKEASAGAKIVLLPVKPDGTFDDPTFFLFDTARISYKLPQGMAKASVKFMENRLPAIAHRYQLPATGSFYNQSGDTSAYNRHFLLSDEALKLLPQYAGKMLEEVTIMEKKRSLLEAMDKKYSSGMFAGEGIGYQFDLVNTKSSIAFSIFQYLQGRVAGLEINTNSIPPSTLWRGEVPRFYLDEVLVSAEEIYSVAVSDVAYVKVFRPPFFGPGVGTSAGTGAIAIYTKHGDEVKPEPGKGLPNNAVTGFTPVRQFYSPNYNTVTAANEKKDIRTTLYWNPQIDTTAKENKVVVSFYNNDVSKSFRVIIEGMAKDGRLVHLEKIMK